MNDDEYPADRHVAFRKAFLRSDTEAMRKFLAEAPDVLQHLHQPRPFRVWIMCDAAKKSPIEVIETLLELGADINEQDSNGFSGLRWAVIEGRGDVAKFLLEHGADPNLNCPIFSVATTQDLSDRIGMAKLLLDNGADVNQPFLVEGLPPRNVLSEAVARGHADLVEFLKSRGARPPDRQADAGVPARGAASRGGLLSRLFGRQPGAAGPARGDTAPGDHTAEIVAHFRKHYGQPEDRVIREIIPTSDNPVAVHYIPLTAEGNSSALFTTGLSRVDLPVPEGAEHYRRAELMLELDKRWVRPEKALKDARWAWPFQWLRKIAGYAANSGNWLGAGFSTFVDEEPPKPLAPGLKFTAWLLASLPSDDTVIRCKDGTPIQICQLFPLYNEEYLYARKHGTEALMSLFVERKIQTYIDLERPNVAIK